MINKISLKSEQEFFEKNKKNLLERYKNKYVLIKEHKLINVYNSAEEAYKEGLHIIGNKPMFIKQVTDKEVIPSLMGFF